MGWALPVPKLLLNDISHFILLYVSLLRLGDTTARLPATVGILGDQTDWRIGIRLEISFVCCHIYKVAIAQKGMKSSCQLCGYGGALCIP